MKSKSQSSSNLVIEIDPKGKRACLVGDFPREDVDKATSAYMKGYQYSPQFRQRRADGSRVWDGKIHLFSRITNTFQLGVIDIVTEVLDNNKITYSIKYPSLDEIGVPDSIQDLWRNGDWTIPDKVGPFELYDYQKDAISRFLDSSRILPYRGVIKIGTGGGKTACGATIAKIVNAPTLFIVHGKKLTRQNLKVFEKIFEDCPEKIGTIDAETWNPQQVTIASSDTLYARMKNLDYEDKINDLFDNITLLIADECHRATSKSFAEIFKAINAPMRLGLSGTPNKKEDDRDLLLHSLTGPIVFEMGAQELKEAGTISKAHLVSVIVNKPEETEELEWQDAFEALIINNTYRHRVIGELVRRRSEAEKTILVLAGNSLDLASNLYQEIVRLIGSENVKLVNGLSGDKLVDSAFDSLQNKKIKCVVTTTIADEGIDIPSVNCLFIAGGGKSFVRTVQRVGRSLRLKEDGSHAEIVDFMDSNNGYLKKHALARLDFYEEEGLFDSHEMVKAEDILEN